MKIEPGNYVIVNLHSPREKLFAILDEITPAGIFVRSIDLGYFDDWIRSIAAGEQHLSMSDVFMPMWRVERISLDVGTPELPSLADKFENATGKSPAEF